MATFDNDITIKREYRPCMADGKRALFHCWVEVSRVHRAVSRSDVTGIVQEVLAICEFEDGTVKKIALNSIKFLDKPMKEYKWGCEK